MAAAASCCPCVAITLSSVAWRGVRLGIAVRAIHVADPDRLAGSESDAQALGLAAHCGVDNRWNLKGSDGVHCTAGQRVAVCTIPKKELSMNWDRVEGNWKQIKGRAKQQWGKLTDDDLDVAAGKRDELAGKVQERYGITKDEAERQVDEWQKSVND